MKVYLDNAASTPIDPAVRDAMLEIMDHNFGNPSSVHSFGREARSVIEVSRKAIAELLNAAPSEIFFTSGGTEADNMAIRSSVNDLGMKHVITSPIEHHAVLQTLEMLEKNDRIETSFVKLKANGHVDIDHLQELLENNDRSLVTLMHGNNEIGNLLSLQQVSELCSDYDAILHSDTVQTIGHYPFDFQKLGIHFGACSGHKFHGPKGIGFIYINSDLKISPLIYGGAQERNMRGGTENIYGIVGLAKAIEIAYRDIEDHSTHIQSIKTYMIDSLEEEIPGVEFNGDAKGNSLYTVLNVLLPPTDKAETLLFNLDISGIAASGGSACASGSVKSSHVLEGIGSDLSRPSIRFSFSKYTEREEINYCIEKLKELFPIEAVS